MEELEYFCSTVGIPGKILTLLTKVKDGTIVKKVRQEGYTWLHVNPFFHFSEAVYEGTPWGIF